MMIVDDGIVDIDMTPDMYLSATLPSELPYNRKSRRSSALPERRPGKQTLLTRGLRRMNRRSVATSDMLRRMNEKINDRDSSEIETETETENGKVETNIGSSEWGIGNVRKNIDSSKKRVGIVNTNYLTSKSGLGNVGKNTDSSKSGLGNVENIEKVEKIDVSTKPGVDVCREAANYFNRIRPKGGATVVITEHN
jgi:hypothetical protein